VTQAIVLAGGQGTRLRPYTTVLPKPLVPIGDRPICEIVVERLRGAGFTHVVFAVNHLAELIEAFFGDGRKWGLEIRYARESEPLGTAGPIAMVEELDDSFLVMNGDVLCDLDLRELVAAHRERDAIATLAAYRKSVPVSLGVIDVGEDERLVGYTEKPTLHYRVCMGIYVFERRVLEYIPRGQRMDLPDLMQALVARGERVHCHAFSGDWFDIGRPEDYEQALQWYEANAARLLPEERSTPR
jgi:NDP-mannose synthase